MSEFPIDLVNKTFNIFDILQTKMAYVNLSAIKSIFTYT